jgi:ATP-dependent RNA helicase DHX37/DHR1
MGTWQNWHAKYLKTLRLGPVSPEDVINPLKVVLMSATLQLKDFISNRRLFDVMPLALNVPARQFPVSVHFSKRTHDDYLWHAYKKVMSIHKRLPLGGILVFVTGQQEVNYLCKKLQRASKQQTDKKPEKVEGDESSSSPDEKEIYEAYDDMFSLEDEINAGPNVDSSDIETESEMDTDCEDDVSDTFETKEEDVPVLEFFRSSEGSSVLKASFKDISKGSEVLQSVEKSSYATSLEQSIPSVPSFSNCTKPNSVSHGKLRVLPLYAMLPASQQLRVFRMFPRMKD